MAEHLLNATEIGSAFEQVRCEGVAEQVWMDAPRLEPGALRQAAEDQEGPGPGQRASLRVQEQVGTVPAVQEGAAVGEVTAQRVGGVAADGDDALLVALARAGDEPAFQVDVRLAEADRLAHA